MSPKFNRIGLVLLCVISLFMLSFLGARPILINPVYRISNAAMTCLTQTVYYEARGEPFLGQLAVAKVVLNRFKISSNDDSICTIVHQHTHHSCLFSWACVRHLPKVNPKAWMKAIGAVRYILDNRNCNCGIDNQTIFYHTIHVHPRWDKDMIRVAQIGHHIFYKPKHAQKI